MLFEVERKRELTDTAALLAKLSEMGYRKTGHLNEVDTYFSRPDVDYMETVECLRVRSRDDFAEVTYKPPTNAQNRSSAGIIVKPETNVALAGVDQAEAANQLMAAIGMRELARVEKFRATFVNPDLARTTITIDVIAGVGTYVETEILAHDADSAGAQIGHIEAELGISELPIVTSPYRDLVMSNSENVAAARTSPLEE
ncbi:MULTISPECIES: class IV adenylate cyclase [Nocardia]|uniref:class IV adenylate cyclase n=1 Tax=Nocardia TaxID=1817 RepID=UPI000D685EE7|nr:MULTISPECIES: class IV adenylate cyclase [Nocardia]